MKLSMKFFLKMMTWAWETGFRAGRMSVKLRRSDAAEGQCQCGRDHDLF